MARIEVRYTDDHNAKAGVRVRFLDVATGQLFTEVVGGYLMCSGWTATGRPGEYHEGGSARITDILYLCGCQDKNVADCAPTCDKPHAEQFRKLHEPGQQYTALAPASGQKFDGDKDEPGLLLTGCSRAVAGIIKVLGFGFKKYGQRNGWKTVPEANRRYKDALHRHLAAIEAGELVDPDSGLPHIDHVACNAVFLSQMHHEGFGQ